MEIKILGTNCPNCKALEKRVNKVVTDNNIDATVSKVDDIADIMSYNIMSTPGLVVNNTVVCKGRVPSESEIKEMLNIKYSVIK